jgi:enoyl-CoA hydratase/carnithine racemase
VSLDIENRRSARWLIINRPDVDNRVDRATCEAIVRNLDEADRDSAVRAVVLTARGKKFCIGGQVDGAADGAAMQQIKFADAFGSVHAAAARLGKPLICAINGDALAGGFSLLSATDLAITVDTARFGLPELGAGLFPMLALATSVGLLPRKLLFDVIYNGRLLSAREALHHGLVSQVVAENDLDAAVIAQVDKLATHSPLALALGRRAYHAMLSMPRDAAISHGGLALVQLLATEDARAAVRAHASGTHPAWQGR